VLVVSHDRQLNQQRPARQDRFAHENDPRVYYEQPKRVTPDV
jgi:hypothetical protein